MRLSLGLDTFSDQARVRLIREVAHPGHHRRPGRVVVDVVDQATVQFHEARAQLQDVPEAGESGAGVVHGQLYSLRLP